MGRVKTRFIKTIAKKLYEKHKDMFTDDYEKNKELIKQMLQIESKKLRNWIAGYITRLKSRELSGS